MTKKGKNLLIWNCHVTMTKNDAYISDKKQLRNHSLTFSHESNFQLPAFFSFTDGLQHHRNLGQANLHRLCGFYQVSSQIWTVFLVQNDSNYLDIKLKVFKSEDKNAEFRLRQNLSMGEADFNQFIRQRNQLVVAADNFLKEQNLSPVSQSTLSKDMEEQLKLVHKVIDVVDRPNRKICVTLLLYKVDNPDTS